MLYEEETPNQVSELTSTAILSSSCVEVDIEAEVDLSLRLK